MGYALRTAIKGLRGEHMTYGCRLAVTPRESLDLTSGDGHLEVVP